MSGEGEEKLPDQLAADAPAEASAPASEGRRQEPRSGTLILVVGPSGSGKDTLLEAARARMQDDDGIVFSKRVITRIDQIGEEHETVSEAEFSRMAQDGAFFLSWHAHGLRYGIATSALEALEAGKTVIVNASRQGVEDARAQWPQTRVVYVSASEEVLRERLTSRGREPADKVEERIQRGLVFDLPACDWLTRIDNSGSRETGVARFVEAIQAFAKT